MTKWCRNSTNLRQILIFAGVKCAAGHYYTDPGYVVSGSGTSAMTTHSPDAIVIGTGVIGTATAFEMAKAGKKTLSLDRNRQIGHGSTAGVLRDHTNALLHP